MQNGVIFPLAFWLDHYDLKWCECVIEQIQTHRIMSSCQVASSYSSNCDSIIKKKEKKGDQDDFCVKKAIATESTFLCAINIHNSWTFILLFLFLKWVWVTKRKSLSLSTKYEDNGVVVADPCTSSTSKDYRNAWKGLWHFQDFEQKSYVS